MKKVEYQKVNKSGNQLINNMTELQQVTSSYPSPEFSAQPPGNNHPGGLPPVSEVAPAQASGYPPHGTYQQGQTTFSTHQPVHPIGQAEYPPPQSGYPPQEKYPPPNRAPPYQAAPPPQAVVINSGNQPVPGQVMARAPQQVQPDDYMVFAILATIFCCLPCGIVAIINASNVRSHFSSGNYEAAQRSSQRAKTWAWVSCLCGIACDSFVILFSIICGVIGPLTWWSAYDPNWYEYYY